LVVNVNNQFIIENNQWYWRVWGRAPVHKTKLERDWEVKVGR